MTRREIYKSLCDILDKCAAECPEMSVDAAFEARALMSELCGIDRMGLTTGGNEPVSEEAAAVLFGAARRRCEGEPLQYIIGRWTFMDREYYVGKGVLIPRDDTEVAVRECISALRERKNGRAVDLCSGSGIIAVTLAKELPYFSFDAVELCEPALLYLRRNIEHNNAENVRAVKGDIFTCSSLYEDGSLDAVISNPPYIERDEIPSLQKEISFEPVSALDGGEDGLDFYRCIAEDWTKKLRDGGVIVLEIGEAQAQAVKELLENNGICDIRIIQDIQGFDRAIIGTKNGSKKQF